MTQAVNTSRGSCPYSACELPYCPGPDACECPPCACPGCLERTTRARLGVSPLEQLETTIRDEDAAQREAILSLFDDPSTPGADHAAH